jgi:catechol 2,3-dioxygenase-like lactoylglutathione lyase family enzyme
MIRGIHHAALLTPDYDRLLAFYRDVIGCEVITDREVGGEMVGKIVGVPGAPRLRLAVLRLGNAYLEIQQYLEPEGSGNEWDRGAPDFGIRHIALDVVDIEAEYERLSAAGMRFAGPPQQPTTVSKSIYGRDPDGNIIELQEILDSSHPAVLFP